MPEKCDLLAALTSNRQPFQVVALSIRHPQEFKAREIKAEMLATSFQLGNCPPK